MRIALWAICITLFVVSLVLAYVTPVLTFTILGEVNSQLPDDKKITPVGSRKFFPMMEMHRQMFPDSSKRRRFWFCSLFQVLSMLGAFLMLLLLNAFEFV